MSNQGFEFDETRSQLQSLRLRILVHSCIYYTQGTSLISDATWDSWARELVELQKRYPKIAERVDYHREFKDFDACTGFHLPLRNPEIMRKAQQLTRGTNNENSKRTRVRIPAIGSTHKESVRLRICDGKLQLC